MSKEEFLDILFAAMIRSVFISSAITLVFIFLGVHRYAYISIAIISEAISMYFTAKHLYKRKFG